MRALLLVVQGFLAINAIVGGALLVLAPDGSLLQLPLSFLHTGLFHDFLIPGLILCVVLGFGHAAGWLLTLRRSNGAARAAQLLGLLTLGWIGVQLLLTDRFWLQGLIATLGAVEWWAGRRMK
ncbi:MAG TPA: hypothetical protein PLL57_13615 [Flavobacteriales bacterium]|nr:hypothetical protein [Flavobacteriales bacterium]